MQGHTTGESVRRVEDPRLLRGHGRYGADVVLQHQSYLHVLRSPHAHARFSRIETAAAAAMPGVLAVLTAADVAADGLGGLPSNAGRKRRDGSPNFAPPRPILARERVRFVGDPVVAVVAETLSQALDAAERIEIDYETLPAVVDALEALKPGAPKVWDEAGDNMVYVWNHGDRAAVERAFAAAHHVTRLDYAITRVTAATLEPRVILAYHDPNDDRFIVHTSVQAPHMLRSLLAGIMKVPETRIRILVRDVGGSFGMKAGVYPEFALAVWAARRLGRPVRWVSERSEAFLGDEHAREQVSSAELALDREGHFLAMRVGVTVNVGAYPSPRSNVAINNIGGIAGVYRTPYIAAEVVGVLTHTQATTPYRGAGRPEASFAIERAIDLAASERGIDRVELRRRNLIPPDAMPFKTGLIFTYDSGNFEKNMDQALALGDWAGFPARRAEASRRGRLRGIGLANPIEVAGGPLPVPPQENAEIRVAPDGSVTLLIGTMSGGQGHETAYMQIVSGRLGVPAAQIRVVQGDTDAVTFGRGSAGSRSLQVGGSAAAMALDKVIAKGTLFAAHLLEASAKDIEFVDASFRVAGTDRKLTFVEVARAAYDPAKTPPGLEPGLAEAAVYRPTVATFPNGSHVCEVEIDPETGAVEVVRYSVVDDVGRVINPMLLKGQIHGGVAQGLGQALFERIAYDPASGQLLSGSFMDYAMPRAADLPSMAVESNEVPTTVNPLGVKGAGEAGTVGALPAVVNAVVDALSPLGIRHLDMPATSERVWRAIQAARGKA